MSVINITITESAEQIVAGVPKSVTVETNIPSTVFYTLDESEPTVMSSVYVGSITMPFDQDTVVLKLFATNGTDNSVVVTNEYFPEILPSSRHRSQVIGLTANSVADNYPYGDNQINPVTFGGPAGITVDDPSIANIPDGYDGAGGLTSGTDKPLTSYQFVYSTTNSKGETGRGIGTLPARTTIRVPTPVSPSTSSNASDKFFNPRAMVIYQDSREPSYDNVSQVNRGFFSLQNIEKDKNGALLLNNAFESNSVTGSFLRSHYNARDNTITYYYRDSVSGRWIISVEPYPSRNQEITTAMHSMAFGRNGQTNAFVFRWIPWVGRRLI